MKAVAWIGALVGALVGALIAVSWLVSAEGAMAVLLGWIPFLWRVLPQMTVDGESAVVGLTALALFMAGVHWLGRSVRRVQEPPEAPAQPWRFRWTAAIVLMVVVSFAAGIAIVGVVHQVGWLANSEQPLLRETLAPDWQDDTRNSMKGIVFAMHNHESARAAFPAAATLDDAGQPLHSWETQIMPFVPYLMIDVDRKKPWDDPVNRNYFKALIPEFINTGFRTPPLEDENGFGLNHFSANSRLIVEGKGVKQDEIKDGTAHTIMLGEVSAGFSPWGRPRNVRDPAAGIQRNAATFGGPAIRGGTYFAMADGSVRLVADDVDPEALRALSTPAGGD